MYILQNAYDSSGNVRLPVEYIQRRFVNADFSIVELVRLCGKFCTFLKDFQAKGFQAPVPRTTVG